MSTPKHILRIKDTQANLFANLKDNQIAFATDTNRIIWREGSDFWTFDAGLKWNGTNFEGNEVATGLIKVYQFNGTEALQLGDGGGNPNLLTTGTLTLNADQLKLTLANTTGTAEKLLAVTADGKVIKVDSTNSVTSVFGRQGDVVAQSGDYTASQVTNSADVTTTNTFAADQAFATGKGIVGPASVGSYTGIGWDDLFTGSNVVVRDGFGQIRMDTTELLAWFTDRVRVAKKLNFSAHTNATPTTGDFHFDGSKFILAGGLKVKKGNSATPALDILNSADASVVGLYADADGDGQLIISNSALSQILNVDSDANNGYHMLLNGVFRLGSITDNGSSTTGKKMIVRDTTTGDIESADVPTGGGGSTILKGTLDPYPTDTSWSGNTYYEYNITVTGAQVGDAVSVNLNESLLSTIVTANAGIEALTGRVTATNNVKVAVRVTTFINIPSTGAEIICAVMQP